MEELLRTSESQGEEGCHGPVFLCLSHISVVAQAQASGGIGIKAGRYAVVSFPDDRPKSVLEAESSSSRYGGRLFIYASQSDRLRVRLRSTCFGDV
jgi:hypothetical protein